MKICAFYPKKRSKSSKWGPIQLNEPNKMWDAIVLDLKLFNALISLFPT